MRCYWNSVKNGSPLRWEKIVTDETNTIIIIVRAHRYRHRQINAFTRAHIACSAKSVKYHMYTFLVTVDASSVLAVRAARTLITCATEVRV